MTRCDLDGCLLDAEAYYIIGRHARRQAGVARCLWHAYPFAEVLAIVDVVDEDAYLAWKVLGS